MRRLFQDCQRSRYHGADQGRRTAPDPDLFKVPADYRIKDESGDFEMAFTFNN